jgi:hypothetical protein
MVITTVETLTIKLRVINPLAKLTKDPKEYGFLKIK